MRHLLGFWISVLFCVAAFAAIEAGNMLNMYEIELILYKQKLQFL
jgi:hypothetical protein